MRQKIHAKKDDERPAALCLSGGGIRSATFCLGVLQGLAKNDLLDKFDYLSTVSGGGYIGSWLSAWLYREGSMDKVQSALSRSGGYPYLFGLEDFKINFTGKYHDRLEEELKNLKSNLGKHKDFFQREEMNDLAKMPLPTVSDLNQSRAAKNDLRVFGQNLCRELNRIILKEDCESEKLKSEIETKLKEDSTQKRIKIKRQIIEEKFADIVNPLDEFEHIEPPEITYLRSYSNFMSPRPGLFSTDTWTLIAIYLRNLLLNWTVFLPLIAMFLLLPRLYSALVNSELEKIPQYILGAVVIVAGITAVTNIVAMRPTLNRFSWVDQHYKIDDIGNVISAESKIRRWCLFPLLVAAFSVTVCWVWAGELKDYQSAMNFALGGFLESETIGKLGEFLETKSGKLICFILFGELLFLGGFLAAHPLFLFFRNRRKSKKAGASDAVKRSALEHLKNFAKEFLASAVSGALGGAVLYLFANLFEQAASKSVIGINTLYVCFGAPLFLAAFLLSATFFVGIAGKIYDDMDREWLSRFGAWILIVIVGWSVLSSVVLLGPELLKFSTWRELIPSSIIGSISGIITLVLGFSRKSPATEEKKSKSKIGILLDFAPQIAAPIFALFLIILISYGTSALMDYTQPRLAGHAQKISALLVSLLQSDFFYLMFWFVVFGAIGGLMGWFININKFSLHAMYRERLIRAYLGASRTEERLKTANSFTDLDNEDNVEMQNLRYQKPLHVVNMTLNLGKTNNLRWQNRKAESFTATALHCGSSNMGDGMGNYRKSEQYGYNSMNKQAITLGTAAAISGAAASPNMGYYSMSSAVSFLMALFNVRLGWWLGNTGERGDDTYNRSAPRFSPRLFFDEALGDTSDTNRYIYLSDGGHFENLGLYEMVLRRCHFIVACDAGADSKFGFFDFGTAIHKIRVDMGIPIQFIKEQTPVLGRNCAIAKIKYSAVDGRVDDGVLIYIKPTLDGDEPIDIVNYKSVNPDFPHETTADQMYSESQFESYRSLGFHMIDSICCVEGQSVCTNISNFVKNAQNYLAKKNESAGKLKKHQESVGDAEMSEVV
ncbi:MAG: patatin-like phospholipase family protein [Acidobacteriota bacterium]|nr:patatin-like phospholipase family protein [Acidobacteriota bacterium]